MLLATTLLGASAGTTVAQESLAPLLQDLLAAGHPNLRRADLSDVRAPAESLYARHGWDALWLAAGRPTPAARELIAALAGAARHGLSPDDSDAAWLDSAATRLAGGEARLLDHAGFDLALTVGALRHVRARWFGRVPSWVVHPGIRLNPEAFDAGATVDSMRQGSVAARLGVLDPAAAEYMRLVEWLSRYRGLARDTSLRFEPATAVVRPQDAYADAGRLRRLLAALGDLPRAPPGEAPSPEPAAQHGRAAADTSYDAELVAAVRRFQARHGLEPDGVIGPETAGALGTPLDQRVRQIEMALDRWRWLPRRLPDPRIMVNLAAFRLTAVRNDSAHRMAVIVGRARTHETPVFRASVQTAVFRPTWEVPVSIMRAEIRPAALRDSGYLAARGMLLLRGDSIVDATRENIERIGSSVRVSQRPGPSNPLGQVKLVLPNPYQVFLHDTPERHLFTAARRDRSHGCVRVERALDLARWALAGVPEWTDERIEAALAGSEPVEARLSRPLPVFVVYQTAEVGESGGISFFADLYGHDARMAALLQAAPAYRASPEGAARRGSPCSYAFQ